jgi:hypothetical protein
MIKSNGINISRYVWGTTVQPFAIILGRSEISPTSSIQNLVQINEKIEVLRGGIGGRIKADVPKGKAIGTTYHCG